MYDIKLEWNKQQLFTGLDTKQSYLFYHNISINPLKISQWVYLVLGDKNGKYARNCYVTENRLLRKIPKDHLALETLQTAAA